MLTAIGFQKLWLNFIQSANVPRDCSQMQQLRPVAILNQRVCALEVLVRWNVLIEISEIDLCPGLIVPG